jgi:amino acid adenylation domain-containing protein
MSEEVEFNPFDGPEIMRVVPAIEPQLEIWASCQIGGADANRAYNESVSLDLKGSFSLQALEKALKELLNRHEALRSSLSADGTRICIYRELTLPLKQVDLSDRLPDKQQAFIDEYAKADAETAFDLVNGPLFRSAVFTLAEQRHYLTITAHHIVCDGWSLGILLVELSALYNAYAAGSVPDLPSAPRLSDYNLEQLEFMQTPAYRQTEQYWINQYKGKIPVMDVPADFSRPARRTYKSHRDDYPLDKELVLAVKKIGAKSGCSLVLLQKLSGQEEIVLGLPAAGQSTLEKSNLIGHCVNLLPMRSRFSPESSFSEYLKKRKRQILEDYDHQQFTFGSLLKKLNISRDPSRIPLVPVVFNIDMGMDNGVHFDGLSYTLSYNPRNYESFEIFLNAAGTEETLVLEWSYNTQLFKPETIRRMMQEFESLLTSVVREPELALKDIRGGRQPVTDQQEGVAAYPKDKTIVDLFSQQVKRTPHHTAVSFGKNRLSYIELDEKSSQLAHYLKARGVGEETLVPICIGRSTEMVVGILAILKAGAAYVPVDPEYPENRISFMLEDTGARVVVCDRESRGILRRTGRVLETICIDADRSMIEKESRLPLQTNLKPHHLAYIIYTSGSTGKPKGVMIEHRNVVRLFMTESPLFDFNDSDVWTLFHSFCFDFSVWEMYGALFYGGRLVVVSRETARDTRAFGDLLVSEGVTILNQTPSAFYALQDDLVGRVADIPVRYVIFGGEALNPAKLRPWKEQYRQCRLINMYGITETTVHVTYQEISAQHLVSGNSIIGKPIPTLTAHILDGFQSETVPGASGELYIGGAGLARGYLNLPALTAERFVPDPFAKEAGARLYRTGDLAKYLPDGNIEYLGRIDDQVKIRGHRIELGEIEHVVQEHPAVKQAVVTAREDSTGDKRLVGYVVPGRVFNKESILAFLAARLPDYMVPRIWVEMEKIPLTGNGKVDRNALPKPDLMSEKNRGKIIAPSTEGQKLVAGIFSETLGIDQISIDDDFFELGGHSLIAVKVMKRLEEKTNKHLPLTSLFEAPTVEKLSSMLNLDEKAISWKSLVQIKPGGDKPPLYIVHGSGLTVLVFNSLAKSMDRDQPVYGLQARGLNGVDEPFDNMKDIAAYYISEILEHNPNGPYYLAGYSFGGIVAYEMVKQLKAMGKEVDMLAIFDTHIKNSAPYDPLTTQVITKVRRQFPKMLFIIESLFRHPKETIQYQFQFFKNKGRRFAEMTRLLKEKQSEEESYIHSNKINEKHDYAYYNYKMTPYDGVIDLFKVRTRLYYLDDPIYLGWKPYALKGIHLHEIWGDHKTFLLPPNDKELAKILSKTLNDRIAEKARKNDFTSRPNVVLKAI